MSTVPTLPDQIVSAAQNLTLPQLTCPQAAIVEQHGKWPVLPTLFYPLNAAGDPLVAYSAVIRPYDPVNNASPLSPDQKRFLEAAFSTRDLVGVAKMLMAKYNRPALVNFILAGYAAAQDLIANGIPDDVRNATGTSLIKKF